MCVYVCVVFRITVAESDSVDVVNKIRIPIKVLTLRNIGRLYDIIGGSKVVSGIKAIVT